MKSVRKYLSEIGAKGGAKSKRKLTKSDARKMAAKRWAQAKPAQAGAAGSAGKRHERANHDSAHPEDGQRQNVGDDRFSPTQPSVNEGA